MFLPNSRAAWGQERNQSGCSEVFLNFELGNVYLLVLWLEHVVGYGTGLSGGCFMESVFRLTTNLFSLRYLFDLNHWESCSNVLQLDQFASSGLCQSDTTWIHFNYVSLSSYNKQHHILGESHLLSEWLVFFQLIYGLMR